MFFLMLDADNIRRLSLHRFGAALAIFGSAVILGIGLLLLITICTYLSIIYWVVCYFYFDFSTPEVLVTVATVLLLCIGGILRIHSSSPGDSSPIKT
jgi:hypothetical protein